MLPRRIAAASARSLIQSARVTAPRTSITQIRQLSQEDIDDPNMNGGYINPPRQKRQFRDPYGDWWDKQERRNFGEPLHEDSDILGIFSPEEYTHTTPGKAFAMIGCFAAAVLGLYGVVSLVYPDRPAVPRTFPGGLDVELGGKRTLLAPKDGEEE